MSTVWIYSPSLLIAKALGELISALGYRVQFEEQPKAELALWDLSCCEWTHLPAPSTPTLALLSGSEALEPDILLTLGYRGFLRDNDGQDALERALESLALGGPAG